MIFQSNRDSITYVVRSGTIDRDLHGRRMAEDRGLRAVFVGSQRLFDSRAAQEERQWSDDERAEVEAFLIGHADFMAAPSPGGAGSQPRIYLAPGEFVPPEHAATYEQAMARHAVLETAPAAATAEGSVLPLPPKRCFAFSTVDGQVTRCASLAEDDGDLCAEHQEQAATAVPIGS